MQKHFVYILQRRDRSGIFKYDNLQFAFEPFYVGKGSQRTENGKIVYDRLKHTVTGGNNHKMNLIHKVKELEITVFNFETENESFDRETEFIEKIGRKDLNRGPLVNWCNGGRMNVDKKSRFKRTCQYDQYGNLLAVFESQDEAFRKTEIGNISRACSTKILAGGYFWRSYKKNDNLVEKIDIGSYFENRMHNGNVPRSVLVTKGNETIKFESLLAASIYTKVGSPTICRACKNKKTYNGFNFEYAS